MHLNPEKTAILLELLKRRYAPWSGFSDPRFARDPAALRPDILEGVELLSETGLRQLVSERRWDEVIGRIDFVARSAANASANAPDADDLRALHDVKLDKPLFCDAVIDLMFGEGDGPTRLQRYADASALQYFPRGWSLPTFLLMLVHPFNDFFIKPEAISWLLDFVGKPFTLGRPRGVAYARVIKLAREVAIHFEDGTMVEMPVIQRLIWLCYVQARLEAPPATLAQEPASAMFEEHGLPAMAAADFKIINIDRENEKPGRAAAERHKDAAVDERAFDLLETMAAAPLSQKVDKAERDAKLERPVLALVRDILTHLPERVRTQFFSVPLTAYGVERGHPVLHVSFYRKGGKWRGEPQLFLVISDEGIECGYSIEWFTGLYLERFQSNFAKNEPLVCATLEDIPAEPIGLKAARVRGGDGSSGFRAESFIGDNQEIRISAVAARDKVLALSRQRLAHLLADAIGRLFPVLQLALDEVMSVEDLSVITQEVDVPEYVEAETPPLEETAIVEAVAAEEIQEPLVPVMEAVAEAEPEVKEHAETAAEPSPITEVLVPDASPNLLEVLAREVEGRAWTEHLQPARGTGSQDNLSGTAALAALKAETAVMDQEYEALGGGYRRNAAYSVAQCAEDSGFSETQLNDWLSAIERKGQAVFFGPPGTGKTFMAEKLARHLIGGGDGFSRLIQMHAGVTYDDFVEARRPASVVGREARSVAVPGRFVEFCREAAGRSGLCVLILDEMHRADISTVVGELLYLMEHRDQEIQLAGGTRFRVPSNVRLIGTMNTVDRSNAFLDTAIRRRFAFLELGPRYEVLKHYHRMTPDFHVEELSAVLESLNRRIANKRFEIGIAYFLRPDAPQALGNIWRTEIEPMVGDFFFDQPGAADAFTWDAVRAHLTGPAA